MLRLEDREWRSFAISEIASISPGRRLTKADMLPGNMPFIGASDSCNGITEYTSNRNESEDCNVLGVNYNGSVVESFYHPYRALFSDDVKRLHLLGCKGNQYIYLFLKTLILKQKSKYQYAYKFNESRLKRQKILIPVTSSGEPDYEFMEAYGRQLLARKISEYEDYAKGVLGEIGCKHEEPAPLKTKEWHEFLIDALFEIQIGKNIDGNKIDKDSGSAPYVTRKEVSNGVDGFIDEDASLLYSDVPVITIGNETAMPFVQTSPFYTGTKINIMKPRADLPQFALQFIATSLQKHKSKYSFSYSINSTRLKKQRILLPVTPSGEPDYDYMEQYAKNIHHKKITEYLDYLGAAKKDLTG